MGYVCKCGAVLTQSEIDWERCAACGRTVDLWEDNGDADDFYDEEDEHGDEYSDCSCPYCYCHQKTPHGGVCGDCQRGNHQG